MEASHSGLLSSLGKRVRCQSLRGFESLRLRQKILMYKLSKNTIFLVSQKALIWNGKKLLILKSSFDNLWELPGGLLDEKETMLSGLKREIKEETGLTAIIGKPFHSTVFWHQSKFGLHGKKYDARIVAIAYGCQAKASKVTLSEEHTDYAWVTVKELSKYRFSINSKFVKDHLLKK